VTRLLIIGLVLLGLLGWALLPQSPTARRTFRRWSILLALAGAALLLVRVGFPWLAVGGAALLSLLRFAGPTLLRLLPLWLAHRMQTHRPQPGNATQEPKRARPEEMTRVRALEILNLAEGASREDVLRAHRELIKRVHPDRGGSSCLASQVNRARDVLLSEGF